MCVHSPPKKNYIAAYTPLIYLDFTKKIPDRKIFVKLTPDKQPQYDDWPEDMTGKYDRKLWRLISAEVWQTLHSLWPQ